MDEALWNLIQHYGIRNEDITVRSDNAPSQYKNDHAFALPQNLADEFNLIIIRT